MVKAMAALPMDFDARLAVAGVFSPPQLETDTSSDEGWYRVDYLGWQDRKDITLLLGRARVGLVVLHPIPNYLLSYPVKLFEYMAAGLPVIASDFPLWRDIIEDANCGIMVEPFNTNALATSIQWLIEHPEEAEEMGKRGQKAVISKYNWGKEAEKLLELYKKILVKN